ncbi:long-chain fatty acid--CoA ligase [bacterium]|nr:long-chain fatty acid--CoA ligase [bacterium]
MLGQQSHFVPDWLAKRAQLTPERIALHCTLTGRDISYAAWDASATQTAHYLRRLSIAQGDRVAVYATNSTEYLDIWMACGKIGAILQNLNWRLTSHELRDLIEDAGPRILIYSGEFIEQINAMRSTLTCVEVFVALNDSADPGDHLFSEREHEPDILTAHPDLVPDSPWVICYTGGTTGLPKGAVLTHGNMTWNSINTVMSWGLDQNDVAILNAPLFHTGGLNVFTLPLVHMGGKNIVCKGFDVDQVFDLIRDAGVTVFFGVPTMFVMMQQHPRWGEADFSGLKIVISGGAPCPMPVFEKFWAKGVDFKTGYGLTEAGPNTFALPPADVQRKPGAVGFPLFHIDVRTVRADGSACDAGEAGELLIRGPHVTPGYWNNPQATAEAIRDGWLHTGDLAVYDDEGYYTIIGRLKDMIISGGENIYPAEIESVIHAHEAVAEAAVIGLPDPRWGEVGCAVVVVKTGHALTEDDLIAFMRARMASYKVPKSVVFVDELPKTGPGKIDKKHLAERLTVKP